MRSVKQQQQQQQQQQEQEQKQEQEQEQEQEQQERQRGMVVILNFLYLFWYDSREYDCYNWSGGCTLDSDYTVPRWSLPPLTTIDRKP